MNATIHTSVLTNSCLGQSCWGTDILAYCRRPNWTAVVHSDNSRCCQHEENPATPDDQTHFLATTSSALYTSNKESIWQQTLRTTTDLRALSFQWLTYFFSIYCLVTDIFPRHVPLFDITPDHIPPGEVWMTLTSSFIRIPCRARFISQKSSMHHK